MDSSKKIEIPTQYISYKTTGSFSKIVTDYLEQQPALQPFYSLPPSLEGIEKAIAARRAFYTNRELLVTELKNQYSGITLTAKQQLNIEQLGNENCFTITTAHQPNIFTGHLYFIYKVLHAIKLADHLQMVLPANNFVPVYYMGSEDADLEELGEVYINGITYHWQTKQTGAVGRMKVDDALLKIIDAVEGQLLVEKFGEEIIALIRECYKKGTTIEQATFKLVNEIFAGYGLIVLLPDSAAFKQAMYPVFEDELLNSTSSQVVTQTSERLAAHYKVQAHPREINLFYLEDDRRERIERKDDQYSMVNTQLSFQKNDLIRELKDNPQKFSPNVILRGLFQETILPNIAFIGGGGELAYWLQLKGLFEHYKVPYPVQLLRNSFMLIDETAAALMQKLALKTADVFKPVTDLLNETVQKQSSRQLGLDKEKIQLKEYYEQLKHIASAIDPTLAAHTENLHVKALKKIEALEKKMLRSEKSAFDAEQRQLQKLKNKLFPNNGLQERVENFMPYYAKYGKKFIQQLYKNSLSLEQEFCIVKL